MNNAKVLIVDDEEDIRELLSITLTRMGIQSELAPDLNHAHDLLGKHEYFLCLTDMRLPDGDGIELVAHVQVTKPELPIAVITAFGNVEGAVNTLKAGAFDYVSKPVNVNMLKELINTAYEMYHQKAEPYIDEMIGDSSAMQELRVRVHKLARSQAPVFIHGESGVGKELVAQSIHKSGPRKSKPFIAVNCGAIPFELMESEFFGHQKGSFTGAIADKDGLFVAANGGTLFLDEIAELPMSMQVKLLRAVQEKAIKAIGSHQECPVDVRILSASHKNLQFEVDEGNFRQDLFYRINVIELRVPPLKEHLGDLNHLIDNILIKLAQQLGVEKIKIVTACYQVLAQYDFPGNVRELENILERAVALCENHTITLADLQLPTMNQLTNKPFEEVGNDDDFAMKACNLDSYLVETERELIVKALEQTKWNRSAAARNLGISFRALRYRLRKLGIE